MCPNHYLNTPALSWHTMLSMVKVGVDLISDVDKNLFFEKCMKVGVSCISKRYRIASNKYLTSYDPKNQKTISLCYVKIYSIGWI